MKKLIFLAILFLGISTTTNAQSKKIELKAKALTEKINKEIIAADKTLALSEDQKNKIIKIQTERITGFRKLGKSASKEEKKKFNKTYYKEIYSKVLTKEQRLARKKAKSKK